MQVNELLHQPQKQNTYSVIVSQCSKFLNESEGYPITKNLPITYDTLHRVKVRRRKQADGFDQAFNEAFEREHNSLRQRAIFAHGTPIKNNSLTESFYIFPINGYRFMYSKEVKQSDHEYKQVFETMFHQFGDEKSNEILSDLLRFTYNSTNLSEGIQAGAEIILYGIPYYYAVRASSHDSYQNLLTSFRK